MSKHCTVEPSGFKKFSATWELTLKCNLDCSYCGKDNHDNTKPHPSLDDCKQTVDFFIEYINEQMKLRPKEHRVASIDIFGGESLVHPEIVAILDYFEEQHRPYKDEWTLHLNTVTNAVVKEKIWDRIVDKFHYYTVSYHVEASDEQLELVRKNVLDLKARNKLFHVSLLMHPKHWDRCMYIIEWCKENDVRIVPRQIDHPWNQIQFWYSSEQADWMRNYHGQKTIPVGKKLAGMVIKLVNMNSEGRQCCGGETLCVDSNTTVTHVDNTFKDWHCAVDKFFVYVKQHTKEIFTNKDCMVNYESKIGPIGSTTDYSSVVKGVSKESHIKCVKSRCLCGICSPKAKTLGDFNKLMEKYV